MLGSVKTARSPRLTWRKSSGNRVLLRRITVVSHPTNVSVSLVLMTDYWQPVPPAPAGRGARRGTGNCFSSRTLTTGGLLLGTALKFSKTGPRQSVWELNFAGDWKAEQRQRGDAL